MAIIGMQQRIREVGRIRLGVQGTTQAGKRFPKKIDKFRLTSPDRTVIEGAAGLYGGKASAWDNGGAPQWEVITDAAEIPIVLPPNPSDLGWSQFYESWAKGFCTARCDGERDTVRDAACSCDPENRECKITSRLSVILPEIPGLGVWRLESHGYYAGVELASAIALIESMAGMGMIPARLRLDQREVRRLIDGEAKVHKFVVPVIDLDVSVTQVQALGVAPRVPALATGTPVALDGRPGWKPVGELPAAPPVTVADQLAELDRPAPKPRKNAATPIKPTGRTPRTAAQAAAADEAAAVADTCTLCGQPYGSEALVRNPMASGSRFVHKTCVADQETPAGAPADPPPASKGEGGADQRVATLDIAAPSGGPDPAPEQDDGGRGGTDGETIALAEPPPATGRRSPGSTRPLTHGQQKKIMAMMAKLFPVDPARVTGREADDYRRRIELGICAQVGSPGAANYTSRSELDMDTARALLDALVGIEAGDLAWDPANENGAGRLVNAATGEPIETEGEPF